MSKCDFFFEFERADRTFRAGEVVRGSVTVSVNQTVNCRNLTLASTWRTHGKGNRAEGVYHSVNLFQGELVAGNKLNYPFEFQIPIEPVTYRGTLINVDHYVTMRADVPWAFDPVGEADFIVLPGPDIPTEEPLASFSKPHSMAGALIASAIAAVFILVGVLFIPFLGLGLIPIGIGIGIIFFAFRNRIAERKLGPVECVIAPASQVPGGELGVRVSFTPRKSLSINKVLIELSGAEIAVSGSGTNKTTHRHSLYDSRDIVAEELRLVPGQTQTIEHFVRCPETESFSFKLGENSVNWTIRVRIDIPRWPDWVMDNPVRILPLVVNAQTEPGHAIESKIEEPTEFAPTHSMSELIYDDSDPLDFDPVATPDSSISGTQSADEHFMPVAASSVTSDQQAIATVVEQLLATERYSSARTSVIEQEQGRVFTLRLVIERMVSTFGVYDAPDYRTGQTAIGVLENRQVAVAVQFPAALNDQVRQLSSGSIWVGQVTLSRWDELYDRLEVRAV